VGRPDGDVREQARDQKVEREVGPAATSPSGGYRIVLEFYLKTTQALDAKYAEMIGFGYESHSAPSDVSPELRFAMVNDTVKGSRKVHHFRQSKSAPAGGG